MEDIGYSDNQLEEAISAWAITGADDFEMPIMLNKVDGGVATIELEDRVFRIKFSLDSCYQPIEISMSQMSSSTKVQTFINECNS